MYTNILCYIHKKKDKKLLFMIIFCYTFEVYRDKNSRKGEYKYVQIYIETYHHWGNNIVYFV